MSQPKATLAFLSAGAAQALVKSQQPALQTVSGLASEGRFGAVGSMREAFDAGEACDLIILTQAMIDAMARDGLVRPGSARPLGRVRTGVAVRRGDARPAVESPEALRAALLAADAIYFPDPVRATAGIHFASVLKSLGIHDTLQQRFCTYPNGAAAMRALGEATTPHPIGCTQVTEILYTEGVDLIGLLPPQFELATVYTAAISTRAQQPEAAAQMVELLSGPGAAELRLRCGFEP
jgi:molybdate transport system substrate-binding protein